MKRPFLKWFWLLLLIPLGMGLGRLRFDVEILNLLPDNLQVAQGLKLYQNHFSNGRELILAVRGEDAEETESAARMLGRHLQARTELFSRVTWQPPWVRHPEQAAELMAFIWLNQPPEQIQRLNHRLRDQNLSNIVHQAKETLATSFSPSDLARRGYDPFSLMELPETATGALQSFDQSDEYFVSSDGTMRLIFIESATDLAAYRDCLTWLSSVSDLVAEAGASSEWPNRVRIGYTGRPAFVAEIAGGMEKDMTRSVSGMMGIIVVFFGITHRRWKPLVWLLALLVLTLFATLAVGGWICGSLGVVSVGFAAILLGLAVDYGMVICQEAKEETSKTVHELRRAVGPGIVWSAITTAGAFSMLNLSVLPGLAQLGTLVAIGILIAAILMLFVYLPLLIRKQVGNSADTNPPGSRETSKTTRPKPGSKPQRVRPALGWSVTIVLLGIALFALTSSHVRFDSSADALRPQGSQAYATLDAIQQKFGRGTEPAWVIVRGKDERTVARRLSLITSKLEEGVSNKLIRQYTIPLPLWPNPDHQQENRTIVAELVARHETLRNTALAQGFTTNSLLLTARLLGVWERALGSTNLFWPTNEASHWVMSKVISQPNAIAPIHALDSRPGQHQADSLALGVIYPNPMMLGRLPEFGKKLAALAGPTTSLDKTGKESALPEIILSGWQLLGPAVLARVRADLPLVLGAVTAIVLCSLWLAFRRPTEVILSLLTLVTAGLALQLVMTLANWSFNLLNLMALPLLLGAGIDYSIHMQLALRRHSGDQRAVNRTVGRALLLCACTTAAGFGSLAFSSNAGLASLGQVCCVGVITVYLTAVLLLPAWWTTFAGMADRRTKIQPALGEQPQQSEPFTE